MRKYNVYRGEDGILTYFPHGDVVYTVRCTSDAGAQQAIRMLKRAEKQNKEEDK